MLLLSNNKGKLMETEIKEEARLQPKQDLSAPGTVVHWVPAVESHRHRIKRMENHHLQLKRMAEAKRVAGETPESRKTTDRKWSHPKERRVLQSAKLERLSCLSL